MKVIWSPQAVQDRLDIWEHIASDKPTAAVQLDERFSETAALLSTQPLMGKRGTIEGTRELLPHKNYRLVYELHGDELWILSIVHAARQWPPT
jgi:addiction module RelE/StbE family toxin